MNIENEEDKKNSKVPIPTRWLIVHYKTMGMTGEQVSQKVSVSASNCNRIYNKYLTTGDVVDLKRTGRPPEIPEKDKKMFIEGAKVHPELNINTLIEETKVDFCKMTGSRLLKGAGYQCRTARVKWFIPPDDRELRLNWARKYIKMPNEFWRRVIFTDECRVQFNTKKEKLWLPKDVVPDPVERDQWQVSVLVWGAIKYNQTSILEIVNGNLNAAKYLSILKRRLMRNLPDLRDSSPLDVVEDTLIFQQDNASVHTANEVKTYFQERSIYVLPWPPKSPDLNLIEEVWAWLKNGLKRSYRNVEELEEDIIYIWESIPSEFIKKLYDSMKNRIQAVIEAQGGPTDY